MIPRKWYCYCSLSIAALIELVSCIIMAGAEGLNNFNDGTLTFQWCGEGGVAFEALKLAPPELETFEIPENMSEDQMPFKIRLKTGNVSCPQGINTTVLTLTLNKSALELNGTESEFSSTGYFRFNNYYYPPEAFCIARWTNSSVSVQVCSKFDESIYPEHTQCDAGITCIPKCCPQGMLLSRSSANEFPQCHPKLNGSARVNPILYTSQLEVFFSYMPVYFYVQTFFDKVAYDDHQTQIQTEHKNFYYFKDKCFRIVEDGTLFYQDDHSWVHVPRANYCIDGTQLLGNGSTRSQIFNGKEAGQYGIILRPLPPEIHGDDIPHFEVTNLLLSSVFLLLTFLVYLLLWKEQNIQGWVTMSHSATLFLCYALSAVIYVTPAGRSGDMASFCLFISVSTHFFYMSNFCWLTITSFSLFRTFRKLTTVDRNTQKSSLYMRFAGFGWGVPFVFVTISLVLDQKYSYVPCNQIPVPYYGMQECFISRGAFRVYLLYPVALLLIINTILFAATAYNIHKYQKSTVFAKENLKDGKESFKMIAKLFFVMGIVWIVDFLYNIWWTYHHTYIAWIWLFPHVALCLQALSIFVIYVCKSSIAGSLKKCYPKLTPLLNLLDKNKSCPSRQDTGTTRASATKSETRNQSQRSSNNIN